MCKKCVKKMLEANCYKKKWQQEKIDHMRHLMKLEMSLSCQTQCYPLGDRVDVYFLKKRIVSIKKQLRRKVNDIDI